MSLIAPSMIGDDSLTEVEDSPLNDDVTGDLAALRERLASLEEEWGDYQDGLAKDKAAKKKKSSYKLGGRIHIDQWTFGDSDDGINVIERGNANLSPENRWTFRRIRLEWAGTVPNNMLWRFQIDFNNPARAEMKDVYLGWTNLPYNQTLLLGNQKRPLGLDHLNSSRFNVFAERPLAVETFNEDARRFGLAMYGHNDEQSTGWAYGIYNIENINTDGRFIGDSYQMGGYARLWRSPWYDETSGGRGYWHWALAGGVVKPDGDVGPNDTNANDGRFRTRPLARSDERWLNTGRIPGADWYEVLAVENMLNLGSLQITGEYFVNWMQREDIGPAGFAGPYDAVLDDNLFFHGGYIYASYFLTGEHMTYKRTAGTLNRVTPHENFFLVDRCRGGTGWGLGAWQIAARYDHLDLTDGGVNGGVADMVTLGLNWHWTAYSKVQNNLVMGTIDESGNANPIDGSAVDAGDFWIFGSRFMIDF
ncbi:MAG: porin [Planctomycetota bacterium]